MQNFYVYVYLDLQNIPFYIGKGYGKRYLVERHIRGGNKLLAHKILKIGIESVIIKFLFTNLPEDLAFEQEEYWISYYGRRDLGKGPLCNLTNGGDGPFGQVFSIETRQKMSLVKLGKHHSEETLQKMSKAHKGCLVSEKTKSKIGTANKNFSDEQEIEICKLYVDTKLSVKKIALIFHCTDTPIRRVLKRHNINLRTCSDYKGTTKYPNRPSPSLETCRKISTTLTGKYVGEKHPNYGKHFSKETKRKQSEAHKGRPSPKKGQKGVQAAWNKGLKNIYSLEAIEKMSLSKKEYWKNKQENFKEII